MFRTALAAAAVCVIGSEASAIPVTQFNGPTPANNGDSAFGLSASLTDQTVGLTFEFEEALPTDGDLQSSFSLELDVDLELDGLFEGPLEASDLAGLEIDLEFEQFIPSGSTAEWGLTLSESLSWDILQDQMTFELEVGTDGAGILDMFTVGLEYFFEDDTFRTFIRFTLYGECFSQSPTYACSFDSLDASFDTTEVPLPAAASSYLTALMVSAGGLWHARRRRRLT